jgi:hypothetical protein
MLFLCPAAMQSFNNFLEIAVNMICVQTLGYESHFFFKTTYLPIFPDFSNVNMILFVKSALLDKTPYNGKPTVRKKKAHFS